ncbi:lipase family protein [Actinomadura madurae]|uniref:lipase family protein n=1 Tax=Actinomadura madurae TaxID=1993 RepID=UPI0020D25A8D|nr:lipase family protein [Actinomadura madurae]
MDPFGHAPYEGVKSWQVLYRSETADGRPTAVSGMVLVPAKAWTGLGNRPLLSYAVGTRGLGDACAPSYTLTRGLDYEELFIADALSRGWAVAVTDMEGLGTPGRHTYEVGRSQGKALLNVARAAQRLPDAGLGGGPVGLWGYSQGGTSSGWAAELAATYAPELAIKGTVRRWRPGGPGSRRQEPGRLPVHRAHVHGGGRLRRRLPRARPGEVPERQRP